MVKGCDYRKSIQRILLFSGLIFLFSCPFLIASTPRNWEAEYDRLHVKIEKNYHEPKGDPPRLEPYLQWLERKAGDRDEVASLLEELRQLAQQNPENKEWKMWMERFSSLLDLAQASGENTVNGAVLRFMRIEEPKFPKAGNWQNVIFKLKNYGRRIYLKAQETRFSTKSVKSAAKCMINFSIRDVEGNPRGNSVYKGRKGEFGQLDEAGNLVIPERDFDINCEPRSSFTYTSKGEPAVPTDMGLDWINQVREEARWWNFGDADKDATDLMEEFFKDSMWEKLRS